MRKVLYIARVNPKPSRAYVECHGLGFFHIWFSCFDNAYWAIINLVQPKFHFVKFANVITDSLLVGLVVSTTPIGPNLDLNSNFKFGAQC